MGCFAPARRVVCNLRIGWEQKGCGKGNICQVMALVWELGGVGYRELINWTEPQTKKAMLNYPLDLFNPLRITMWQTESHVLSLPL